MVFQRQIKMLLLALASIVAVASADCEACISGRCHSKQTLLKGIRSNKMTIDRKNNILYIPVDSDVNATFHFEDLKVHLISGSDAVVMYVTEDTETLYIATNDTIYKYDQNNNTKTVAFPEYGNYEEATSIYLNDVYLAYAKKYSKGFYFVNNATEIEDKGLKNYTISDFVYSNYLYFVSNNTVYKYNFLTSSVATIAEKNYVLYGFSEYDEVRDRFYNDVYLGDAELNVIYKIDEETLKLIEYASYQSGSVDKFVFNNKGTIIFYDHSDMSVNFWKIGSGFCSIEAPHTKYQIKEHALPAASHGGLLRIVT